MANLKSVDIQKGIAGNAAAIKTSASALLATGVAIAGKVAYNIVYTFTSLKQAELLGITAAYDLANKIVLYQHIKDFYSYPLSEGVELKLMVVDMGTDVAPANPSALLEDTTAVAARKLLISGGNKIKQLGFALNLAENTVETFTDGVPTSIRSAIAKAQSLYDWAYANDRPCNILLECRAITDNVDTMLNLHAIPAGITILDANKVSLVIAQDWDYAETRTGLPRKYAGVGKALGAVAVAEVNQSIGEVGEDGKVPLFNLSNATTASWINAGLSNHKKLADVEAYLGDLNNKGYLFARTYTGVSGYRWNGDYTCTPITVGEDGTINEHTIYYGRTVDLCAMELKSHLMHYIKYRVAVNSTTGKLGVHIVRSIEASCDNKVFGRLASNNLIVMGKTSVDVDSPVLPPDNKLNVDFFIVPYAILDEIKGTIYLKKKV
jgi:hypothetical protein